MLENKTESHNENLKKITAEYNPSEKVIIYNGNKYLDEEAVHEHGEVDYSKLSWDYIITNSIIIMRK